MIADNLDEKSVCVLAYTNRGVAQLGSALAWGARGRWFESSLPDQNHRYVV